MKKKRILLTIVLLTLLLLSGVDQVLALQKQMASKLEIESIKTLLPVDLLISSKEKSGCLVNKVEFSKSFNCSTYFEKEYAPNGDIHDETSKLLAHFEQSGWQARDYAKEDLLNGSHSFACAELKNNSRFPAEKVKIDLCRMEQSADYAKTVIKINAYSSYRPSWLWMVYRAI